VLPVMDVQLSKLAGICSRTNREVETSWPSVSQHARFKRCTQEIMNVLWKILLL
jgi:hypothetical protein